MRNGAGQRAAAAIAALAAVAAWGARGGGAALADEPGTKLPPGVVACAFDALANDPDPAGANIRQAPSASAPILGALPQVESAEAEMGKIPPAFHVISNTPAAVAGLIEVLLGQLVEIDIECAAHLRKGGRLVRKAAVGHTHRIGVALDVESNSLLCKHRANAEKIAQKVGAIFCGICVGVVSFKVILR